MVDLKSSDIRIIDLAFQSDPGYCLNFSDRTFSEFFEDELRIDIDDPCYRAAGASKMNRLRTFFRISDAVTAVRAMRSLTKYREEVYGPYEIGLKKRLDELVERIQGTARIASTDALDRFTSDQTLDELIAAIERDIIADKPAVALDRLHTYCSKKFGHLLDRRKIDWSRGEPLHSRVGKYVKSVDKDHPLQEMTRQILKNSIGVLEKFNQIRNQQSLAHDNTLLDQAEARFIFDSVSAILRFIRSVDTARFDN